MEKARVVIRNIKLAYKTAWRLSKKVFLLGIIRDVVLANFTAYLGIYLIKKIVDYITISIKTSNLAFDSTLFLLCALLFLIKGIEAVYIDYITILQNEMEAKSSEAMQNELIKKISQIKMEYFEQSDFYNKFHRARSTASHSVLQIFNYTNLCLSSIVSIIIAIPILLNNDIWIAFIIAFLSVFHLTWWIKSNDRSYQRTVIDTPSTRKLGFLSGFFSMKNTIQEIKLNDSADFLNRKQKDLYSEVKDGQIKLSNWQLFWESIIEALDKFGYYSVYLFCALRAFAGKISVGDLTYVVGVSQKLTASVKILTSMLGSLYDVSLMIDNYYYIINCEEERPFKARSINKIIAKIEIKNLCFRYPNSETKAVDNVSFSIKSGEKICIVGHNGAGKTTLIKLILGLYSSFNGNILYDDINSNDLGNKNIYDMFTVAMQDYCKFPFTVYDNILISDAEKEKNKDEIVLSAKKTNIHNFISELPKGYETFLNKEFDEYGTDMSEGQWHKIVLARALFRCKDVLVFDEPSASLDPIAEKEFIDLLFDEYKEKTVIIISHRLSCCLKADNIIVMESGKIVEQGKHSDLMNIKNGLYRKMFAMQAESFKV